jgi:hypothetical protein
MPTYYARPTENITQLAAITASGSVDTDYGAAFIADLDPANWVKFNSTSGWVKFDFTSTGPVTLRMASLHNHNLPTTAVVTLQGNNTDDWGAPSFSQAFTIDGPREDGYSYGPWLDMSEIDPTYTFFRLNVTGAGLSFVIGEICLCTQRRTFPGILEPKGTNEEDRPAIIHRTETRKRLVYSLGPTAGRTADVPLSLSRLQRDEFRALHRYANGIEKAWVFVRDSGENDAQLVAFMNTTYSESPINMDRFTTRLKVEELSFGLRP